MSSWLLSSDAVRLNDREKKKVHHYLVPALHWSIVFYGGDGEKSERRDDENVLVDVIVKCSRWQRARDIKSSACLISIFLHSKCDILRQRFAGYLGKNKARRIEHSPIGLMAWTRHTLKRSQDRFFWNGTQWSHESWRKFGESLEKVWRRCGEGNRLSSFCYRSWGMILSIWAGQRFVFVTTARDLNFEPLWLWKYQYRLKRKWLSLKIYQSESSQWRSKRRRSQAGMLGPKFTKGRLAKIGKTPLALTHLGP
jgi:hypothetical protein